MSKFRITFLLMTFLISCSNHNKHSEIFEWEHPDVKIDEITLIKGDKLLDPWKVSVLDTFLIVANQEGNPLVEIYSTSGKLIKKIVNKGSGPSEILVIGGIQVDEKNRTFILYDLFRHKLLEYKIDEVLTESDYEPNTICQIKINLEQTVHTGKMLVGKDVLVCESKNPEGRVAILDYDGNIIKFFQPFPREESPNNLSDISNAHLYSCGITMAPSKTRFATATYNADMLDLYSINKEEVKLIWSHYEFFPNNYKEILMGETFVAAFTNESRTGYLDICSTQKYVYALFSGKKKDDKNYSYGSIIRVVDWAGKERKEYITNRIIKRIIACEDNKTIYAISKNSIGEPEIVKFSIKHEYD